MLTTIVTKSSKIDSEGSAKKKTRRGFKQALQPYHINKKYIYL